MKLLMPGICVLIFTPFGFGQMVQQPQIGFNKLVFDYKVSTIQEYALIFSDTSRVDSVLGVKHVFDKDGFLVSKVIPNIIDGFTVVRFDYNEYGYLSFIDTVGFGLGQGKSSLGDNSDTTYVEIKSNFKNIGNKKMLVYESETSIYPDGSVVKRILENKYNKGLLTKSKLIQEVNKVVVINDMTLYYYTDSGFLDFQEYYENSKCTGKKVFVYSFFL